MPVEELSHRHGLRGSLRALAIDARRGDERAFEALHARLGGGLKRFLQRRLPGNPELLEELAQMVWVEAWRALCEGRYDPERAAFSTFLYAIAYKVFLRHLRSEGVRRGRRMDFDEVAEGILGAGCGLDEVLDFTARLEALRECVDDFRDHPAAPEVELRILGGILAGMSERELAAELEIAPSTVNARKRAALDKLRRCLANKGFREQLGKR